MNKYIFKVIIVLFIIMTITIVYLFHSNKQYENQISVYDNNFKALNLKQDSLNKSVLAYRFNIEQLEYINDSIINNLNTLRKELKIKDSKIEQMQYFLIEGSKKDSIFLKDTIFTEKLVRLDTLIDDDWCKLNLTLEYPNKIKYQVRYRSELNVFAYSSKEIIGTPKKCFIGRWFQKKHRVIRVDVVDNNPYSEIKNKKFVIIEK